MLEMVERAGKGDRDAFADLAQLHVDRLYAIARRILQDQTQAEDAVQSTLLGAWRDLRSLREPSRFEQWLNRLLVRACYAEARQRRAFSANVRAITVEPAVGDLSREFADRDQLERAFHRLSTDQRAVVVLHFYAGLALTEVAEALGIPEGTTRSRLHYALRLLRAAVEADDRSISTEGRMA